MFVWHYGPAFASKTIEKWLPSGCCFLPSRGWSTGRRELGGADRVVNRFAGRSGNCVNES